MFLNKITDNLRKRLEREREHPTDTASYSSLMWYYSKVKTLRKTYRSSSESPIIEPGRMFLLGYNPRSPEDLDYYDVYPVIFVIGYTKNGFLGLNLHYLPLDYRSRLFSALVSYNSKPNRLDLSYNLIKTFSQSALAKVCIRRYISTNITDMVHIPQQDWAEVSGLPIEVFKKRSKETVWNESLKKIRDQK